MSEVLLVKIFTSSTVHSNINLYPKNFEECHKEFEYENVAKTENIQPQPKFRHKHSVFFVS